MRTILTIFFSALLIQSFSQDSSAVKQFKNIEFKNDLDKIIQTVSYKKAKQFLSKPDSSSYSWESSDFGGPRIFRHYWNLKYNYLNTQLQFTKITGRRKVQVWRPILSNAKLSSISMTSGKLFIDNNTLIIGSTVKKDIENMLKGYSFRTVNGDYIYFRYSNQEFRLFFNEKNLLNKIKVFVS